MSIKEQLLNDFREAMRDKDVLKKETLQICRAAILQVEKDRKIELDDAGAIEILSKEHKKRSETLPELGDREDVISKYKAEMAIIEKYLPVQMTEAQILEMVKATIAEVGASSARDMGKVMQAITPKVKGLADGKLVNQIVRNQLGA
ncbi:MAG: GatB/YqeY domain-containing protein [Saccharofermentanales bacterium]